MDNLFERRKQKCLEDIADVGCDPGIWEYYFDNRNNLGVSFVIPITGAESSGKTTIASDISRLICTDFLFSTDYIRYLVSNHHDPGYLFPGIDSLTSEMLHDVSKQKISYTNGLSNDEKVRFRYLLEGTGLEDQENVGNALAMSYSLASSYIFKSFLEEKKNRTSVIEGVHMIGYPEVVKRRYETEDHGGHVLLDDGENPLLVVPVSLAFNDERTLKDSYYEKRLKSRKADEEHVKKNMDVILGYNRLLESICDTRGTSPLYIDCATKYEEVIKDVMYPIQEAIEFVKDRK